MSETSRHDSEACVFLCCLDIIDRLDTLILEIRHIQKNIIYVLRTPKLYQLLKKEENFIWHVADNGHSPWDLSADPEIQTDEQLVAQELPLFPKPFSEEKKEVRESDQVLADDIRKLVDDIQKLVDDIFTHGVWSTDQRAHYRNLVVLQQLKASVVKDKLRFCREAVGYFQALEMLGQKKDDPRRIHLLGRLLLLRSVMLARARNYVERTGDLQAVFARSQDYGLQDSPRPSVNRRRDQHVYAIHLANRCRDVRDEMGLLMDEFGIPAPANQSEKAWVFHRWQHHYSSHWYKFSRDEAEIPRSVQSNTQRFYYVNTSYWMPERPDLQAVIIHEIAHTIIDERLDDLFPATLDGNESELVRFLKHISQAIEHFFRSYESNAASRSFWKELSADILAASVNGPSYLYALLLEILGSGIEELFTHPIDVDIYDPNLMELIDKGFSDQVLTCEWYCRLMVTAKWVECSYPATPDHDFVQRLIKAVETLSEQLLSYLEQRDKLKPRQSIRFWRHLSKRLCRIVEESEDAANKLKKWSKDRADDHYKVENNAIIRGEHRFPRATRRLNWSARSFLVGQLNIEIQQRIEQQAGEEDDDISNKHWDIYRIEGLKTASEKSEVPLKCPTLFPRLVDIPWQYALLRSLDFVHPDSLLKPVKDKKINQSQWFTLVHTDTHMGRNLYWLGLEIYLRQYAPPSHRLNECCGWVTAYIENASSSDAFIDELTKWQGNRDDHTELLHLIKDINKAERKTPKSKKINNPSSKLYHFDKARIAKPLTKFMIPSKYQRSWLAIANNYCALKLVKWEYQFANLADEKIEEREWSWEDREKYHRRLLRVQGFKIEALYQILLKNKNVGAATELKDYLALRNAKIQHDKFFTDTEQLFTFDKKSEPLTLIRRYYVAGSYDIGFLIKNRDVESIKYQPNWNDDLPIWDKHIENKSIKERYSYTLGRNDAISLSEDIALSRCRLPNLPKKGKTDENRGLAYFERKEVAIRVNPRAFFDPPSELESSEPKKLDAPLAFLFLSLRHGTARLDFLVRLLKALAEDQPSKYDVDYIHQISGLKISTEHLEVYLCDGWSDILLVFHDPNPKKSNETEKDKQTRYNYVVNIFRFQNVLFQDFQVDRTEIVPTPVCAELAMTKYNSSRKNDDVEKRQLVINFNVRLLEDRYSELKNKQFIKQVQEGLKKLSNVQLKNRFRQEINSIVGDDSQFKEYLDSVLEKPIPEFFESAKIWLENNLDNLVKKNPKQSNLEEKLQDLSKKLNKAEANAEHFAKTTVHLSRTPGRLDFSFRIQSHADLRWISYDEFLQHLKLGHSSGVSVDNNKAGHVDRLQTTLAYRYVNEFEMPPEE